MQEQMSNQNRLTSQQQLNSAYGLDSDATTMLMAKKRTADDAQLDETQPTKKNTVAVKIEDDEEQAPLASSQQLQVMVVSESIPDTKFEWRFLSTVDHIRAVIKVADTLSANGDYLNINPDSAAYSARFNEPVDCGWNFQFQSPPMVSTTGLHESTRYPGQWSSLLASNDNMNLCSRLKIKAEVPTFVVFLRNLLRFLNEHLVQNGEQIFLKTAQRLEEEKKDSKKYRDVKFVTQGKNDEMYGALWKTGVQTEEKYSKAMQGSIASWFVAYENNEPSVNVRAYPKKVNGVRDDHTPDIVILNEAGDVEPYNPSAPYCVGGATSWECLLKVSVKWYDNQFRPYLNIRSIRYYVNGTNSGSTAPQNDIIFTDSNGNKRRVTNK